MSRARIVGLAVMLLSFAIAASAQDQGETHKVGFPDVVDATDIPYPVNTTTTGMVALLLTLGASGSVRNTLVLQDVPPLTAAALSGVQNWKFTPGRLHGEAATLRMPVYIVFNPYNPAGTATVGGGLRSPRSLADEGIGGSAVPPQVRLASYAMYPGNTVATGTVVLSVNINEWGHSMKIKVVHGAHPLTDAAMEVVKQWGFQPATFGGGRVAGRVCIAFVFQRNLS